MLWRHRLYFLGFALIIAFFMRKKPDPQSEITATEATTTQKTQQINKEALQTIRTPASQEELAPNGAKEPSRSTQKKNPLRKLLIERKISSLPKGPLRKHMTFEDVSSKDGPWKHLQIVKGARAFRSESIGSLESGYEEAGFLGPYTLVIANQSSSQKKWSGPLAHQITDSSFPIIVSKQNERLQVLTGSFSLTLKNRSDLDAILKTYNLSLEGQMPTLSFYEVKSSPNSDLVEVFRKLQNDERVKTCDLAVFKEAPSLK